MIIYSYIISIFCQSVFYRNIAPVNWFLRIIGVLPIVRRGPSRAKFALNSAAFVYSVVFFVLLAVSELGESPLYNRILIT